MAGEKQAMTPRTKLPINMSSKYMRKCPNCSAPMVQICLNCGFKNDKSKEGKERKAEFTKASHMK
jgi:hypothetical protein